MAPSQVWNQPSWWAQMLVLMSQSTTPEEDSEHPARLENGQAFDGAPPQGTLHPQG